MLPVGSPATGNDFIDREIETKLILDYLEKDHILLIAPRRYGKTSVMKKIEHKLSEDDTICIFLEVEDVSTPSKLLTEMIMGLVSSEKLEKTTKMITRIKKGFGWFKDNIESLEFVEFKAQLRHNIESDLQEEWDNKAYQTMEIVKSTSKKVVIIIDEFPYALKKMEAKDREAFLSWFRKVRMTIPNVKFVVGGSVSIDNIVDSVGESKLINDFKRVKISGFNKKIALGVVERTFEEEKWSYSPEYGTYILECIGDPYIPYFLAIFLSAIKDETIYGEEISSDLLRRIYETKILGSEGKQGFIHYKQRLATDYPKIQQKIAKRLLDSISRVEVYPRDLAYEIYREESGKDDLDEFCSLLADLAHDYYIVETPSADLKFHSKLLKDWWRIYHGY
ncbi:ATP-binding protein [Methanofollis ethanolicus]|uniref:ATP-binding protein n=1 Tax=Methanofollis ethanolicus TaxID=488124 RepID=UPI000835961A|nr:ATP-binding protein [Methanofollis ethanolicus]